MGTKRRGVKKAQEATSKKQKVVKFADQEETDPKQAVARQSKEDQADDIEGADEVESDEVDIDVRDDEVQEHSDGDDEAQDESDDDDDIGFDDNDEFDVEGDDEDEVLNDDDMTDSDEEPTTKPKSDKEKFSNAISAILGSKLKSYDRNDPVLVRSKKKARELEESRIEAKAKRALHQDKKTREGKDRVKNLVNGDEESKSTVEALEYEKELKRVARKGVVRLFNAVLASQAKAPAASGTIGLAKQQEKANQMSKENFLDLIRAG